MRSFKGIFSLFKTSSKTKRRRIKYKKRVKKQTRRMKGG